MKKQLLYIYTLLLGGVLSFSACSDFTDLQPKGKNLLSTTTELEMLLNREFYFGSSDLPVVCGDIIYAFENVPTLINRPQKSRMVIMMTWNEELQDYMAELTSSDYDYTDMYSVIGTVSNPILTQVEAAEGPEAMKNQLKCEALTLRALFHYVLVNKYAKAYNPSTAATDGGIVYLMEGDDITQPLEQKTVQEVYGHILADVQEAIDLDGLPVAAVNRMRVCKAMPYALKAMVLLSMQRYDEAEEAARQSLALNSEVDDYNSAEFTTTTTGYFIGGTYDVLLRPRLECKEDLFFTQRLEYADGITPYAWNLFEEGHASRDKIATMDMLYDYLMDAAEMTYGITGYHMTYDLNSGWNEIGLKTTHMYLAVAEAEIHRGDYNAAMAALDKIRVNRINPEIYQPLEGTVTTEADAIKHLKQTSHGENIYSYWNFITRKRWNQVSGWEETITRELGDQTFTLSPNSPMWIFPFPTTVIGLNPNLQQNYNR